jgi:cytochrome c-type biogenesis protein
MEGNINLGIAFFAGLASFLSPCVFALVPAYIGYLGGRSAASGGTANRWYTFSHALAFVLGFSLIFVILGLTATAISNLLYDTKDILVRVGGVVVFVFGLHMTGLLRIRFLDYDLRPQTLPDRRQGYFASGLMGIFFAAGWSPCVGPVLGSILALTWIESSVARGGLLLMSYSAGLAIPFLVASTQISLVTTVIRRYGKVMHYTEKIMGAVLMIIGALLFFNRLSVFSNAAFFFGDIDEALVGRLILIGLIVLAFLGLIPAFIARQKGRSFTDWWLFGASLFPIALIAAFVIKPRENVEDASVGQHIEAGPSVNPKGGS